MAYSLVVSTFSERQAQQIQSPVAQATLTGLGYNSRTPTAIVMGRHLLEVLAYDISSQNKDH
jgi:hypothetical protein